ncbi:MAG: bifunctional nuclease family protein [Thermodesulfobacteriota bacterium]|nr:bifunctional nuclease family protein [Thermodesulfobacteriota bacterium]
MVGMVKMKVAGIALDPASNAPIVILQDKHGNTLPIWVGMMEAASIGAAMEGISYARPMTHDLFSSMLKALDARVLRIGIVDIRENVFYAEITIAYKDGQISIDARPSDAIAIALRQGAEIFASKDVIDDVAQHPDNGHPGRKTPVIGFEQDEDKLKKILENMSPEDFGKFKA